MGDADIEMSGVEPSPPILPYGVLYPPPLPDKLSNGQHPDWARHAYHFGARDDLWGEGFETRMFNFSDPTRNGKFSADDWDVQYMLGPANQWVSWDPITTKWGLQVLEKAGFINLEVDVRNALADPKGRFFDKRPSGWRDDPIHPIFRKDMWRNITDLEYDTLRPAFLLASALLDDPTTLCLFHALFNTSDHITFQDPNFKTCRKLQVPTTLTDAEQLSTFHKICDMRQWTSFQWEDTAKMAAIPAFGKTGALKAFASGPQVPTVMLFKTTTNNSLSHTYRTKISMSRVYCEALMQYQSKDETSEYQDFFNGILAEAGVPTSRKPSGLSNNLESAHLRTTVLFAGILLHEFAHAFCFAYFAIPDLDLPTEPWVGDSRDGEFGWAMERHVFGAVAHGSNFTDPRRGDPEQLMRVSLYAPFGIHFTEKPHQWAMPGDASKRYLVKGSEKDFESPCVYYPLAQQQIYSYFNTKMWTEDVPRYGLDAVQYTKISQWAVSEMPGPNPSDPSHLNTLR
ncbi:hypothetical protein KCU89_g11177, partial [Aureobasidium melanogenum]